MPSDAAALADGFARAYLLPMGWKLSGAAVVFVGGWWVAGLVRAALARALKVRHIDPTLARYLETSVGVGLRLLVVVIVLSVLGVETTSFAALIAAAGIAVGAAWAGLLSNFAAGVFLLLFRPFQVGDTIGAAGVVGVVREVGLFVTAIDTADGVLTYVSNSKLFADNVQNFSANEYRRVDLTATLPNGLDLEAAMSHLRQTLLSVPHVLKSPAPVVEILTINATGSTLAVRPFCRQAHYWQVYFDVNREIGRVLTPALR
jgi:small conductance mechanosensitive channel